MEELYLLDENLKKIYIIDTYSSVIWTPRYNTLGDCELVIQASKENLNKVKECKYISREDDELSCEIKKIEIQTDEENGDQIIITGTDIKDILNKRIVMNQTNFNGLAEDYIRKLITDAFINPKDPNRKISNFMLDDKKGFTETIREQVTYDYIGNKVQEICQQFGWGYKVTIKNGNFVFSLYKGEDRSQYITFSQNYDNISTTDYQEDNSNIKNVALIAGEGEGVDRKITTVGSVEGINRIELYVDARDVSSTIDYDELVSSYPNGREKTINNVIYYQVNGNNIAIITKDEEGEVTEVKLCNNIYTENLKSVGNEKMAEYVQKISFSGKIITGVNYIYKKDYNLGDIVKIVNEYGMAVNARITEIIENRDENGYSMEPTFENV